MPYKVHNTAELPESALNWDMKALSRQHFFTTIGVALDPGNIVLSCMLLACVCRSGAAVHKVDVAHDAVRWVPPKAEAYRDSANLW